MTIHPVILASPLLSNPHISHSEENYKPHLILLLSREGFICKFNLYNQMTKNIESSLLPLLLRN